MCFACNNMVSFYCMLPSRKAIVLRFDPNVQLSIAKLEYFSNKYTNTLTHTGGGVGVVNVWIPIL